MKRNRVFALASCAILAIKDYLCPTVPKTLGMISFLELFNALIASLQPGETLAQSSDSDGLL